MGPHRPRTVVGGHRNAVHESGPIWGWQGHTFIQQLLSESQGVWQARAKARDGLSKARPGPRGTMAWAWRELQLHQQAERQDVPRAPLN